MARDLTKIGEDTEIGLDVDGDGFGGFSSTFVECSNLEMQEWVSNSDDLDDSFFPLLWEKN